MRPEIKFDPEPHTYSVRVGAIWRDYFPSVTTVTKHTVPIPYSAGEWTGMKMGVNAVYEVFRNDRLPDDFDFIWREAKAYENPREKLRKAGDRGTAVHEALEEWGKTGKALDPSQFNEEDQKRIVGLAKWLTDNDPQVEEAEVRTASIEHEYVGTFDAYVTFGAGEWKGKRALLDWKTSKSVYPDSYFPQLCAYLEAEREAGIEPVDFSAVVHIPASGRVKLHENTDTFQDFKVLLDHYRSIIARDQRIKEAKAEAKNKKEAA